MWWTHPQWPNRATAEQHPSRRRRRLRLTLRRVPGYSQPAATTLLDFISRRARQPGFRRLSQWAYHVRSRLCAPLNRGPAIATYQGRIPESTNNCTITSALVEAYHLDSHGGITNSRIVQVIDHECSLLLREIRIELGLGESDFTMPSDVHDHLVDRKVLHQKHFEGATEGNIMDPNHFGEFIKLLSVGDDGKAPWSRQAAATLSVDSLLSGSHARQTWTGRDRSCFVTKVLRG
jgi:hypothetical protein